MRRVCWRRLVRFGEIEEVEAETRVGHAQSILLPAIVGLTESASHSLLLIVVHLDPLSARFGRSEHRHNHVDRAVIVDVRECKLASSEREWRAGMEPWPAGRIVQPELDELALHAV